MLVQHDVPGRSSAQLTKQLQKFQLDQVHTAEPFALTWWSAAKFYTIVGVSAGSWGV